MSLVALRVSGVVYTDYSTDYNMGVQKFTNKCLKKNDTYTAIFSEGQDKHLNILLKEKSVNIIYKSEKAVNKTPGHGTFPRNTLVVFELK